MSGSKRKRSDDHYSLQYNQSSSQHKIGNGNHVVNSVYPQQIIVNESDQVQLLNCNMVNDQSGQSNLMYIIVPTEMNSNQNVLQGVQTLFLIPKSDPLGDTSSQVQYCVPANENSNVVPPRGKVVPVDIEAIKQEPILSIESTSTYGEPQIANNILNNGSITAEKNKVLFKCDHPGCTLSFPSLYEKKLHADVHIFPPNNEYKCNICNMPFNEASERNKHVDSHTVVSNHKCRNCNQIFPYYTTLVKHINEGKCCTDKLIACRSCGVQFVDVKDLEKHQQDHVKYCICRTKLCSKMAFDMHKALCTMYKEDTKKILGSIRRPRILSKKNSTNDVIVLD